MARSVVDVALERARREGMKRRGLIDAFARRIGASEGDIVVRARVMPDADVEDARDSGERRVDVASPTPRR